MPRPLLASALALAAGGALGAGDALDFTDPLLALGLLLLLVAASAWLGGRSRRRAALLALFLLGAVRASGDTGFGTDRVEILQRNRESSRIHHVGPAFAGDFPDAAPELEVATGILKNGERALRLEGGVPILRPRGLVSQEGSSSLRKIHRVRTEPDQWLRIPERTRTWTWLGSLADRVERIRTQLSTRFRRLNDDRAAKLLASICTGVRLESEEPRGTPHSRTFTDASSLRAGSDADLFTRTGTRHLLAVSGLHVGLLALLLFGPLSHLLTRILRPMFSERRCDLVADALTLLTLAAFVLLAGARAPVQRAGLALAFLTLMARVNPRSAWARSLQVRRRIDPLSALGAALLVECLFHPAAARSLSVQLSYSATIGLLLWTRPLSLLLGSVFVLRPLDSSGRVRFIWVQRPLAKLTLAFRNGVAASIAATLATLPFAVSTFGEFSPVGSIATPLCLPLFAALLVGAWIFLAFPFPWIGEHLVEGTNALFAALEFLDRLPATPLSIPPRPFLFVGFACWSAGMYLQTMRTLHARLAALAGGVLLLPWILSPTGLELIALDVGQGTAVLFRAPGEPGFVFDAGSRDRPRVADEAVLPQLRAWDPPSIRIACSHAHRDHASALPRIARRFVVSEWLGAPPTENLEPERAHSSFRILDQKEPGWLTLASRGPWQISLGRGAISPSTMNERSRDLLLEERGSGRRILLCGDAEAEGRAQLLRTLPQGGPFELCLLPHHGTARGQLGPTLDTLRPRRVWISRGEPAPAEAELQRRAIDYETTHESGPLRFAPRPPGTPGVR